MDKTKAVVFLIASAGIGAALLPSHAAAMAKVPEIQEDTPPSAAPYTPSAHYDPDALLGSRRGGNVQWDFCAGKPDDTALPPDPRTLVQPGANAGKAVHFNAVWRDCHINPEAVGEEAAATTCGELRDRWWRGDALLNTGGPGVAALFAGNDPNSHLAAFGISTLTAAQYNNLWRIWGGFLFRPSNFDELVAERYGSGFGPTPNPYPRPGENPNHTNGGSGTLPEMFTQLRNADGSWSGRIGVTCHACHSGVVGTPEDGPGLGLAYGGGSSLADMDLLLRDTLPLGYPASLATFANLSRRRGTNNASDVNLAFLFPDQGFYSLSTFLGLLNSGSTASMDTPPWWNLGSRPVKFADGMFPADAPRTDMVFYTPFFGLFGSLLGPISEAGQQWMRDNGPALNTWAESLKSPAYPFPVNQQLAEQGSVIFHELDMWAFDRHNPIPRPEGNGSCASCHGAYAPRYVNDINFLDSPTLDGIASYIVPQDIMRVDPVRLDTNNEAVQVAGAINFFGYPETQGTDNDCGPQNQQRLRGDREPGYLTPPLHGIWASAPYMHNGSIPNVWEILKPSDRKPLWRRVSKPKPAGQSRVIMGYDTDLHRAYDKDRLGWKYETVSCQFRSFLNPQVSPYISCDPRDEDAKPLAQTLLGELYSNLIVVWNVLAPPTLTNSHIEDRKIFNTHMHSQSNAGHDFTEVLTDAERHALIEYMKTL